MKITIDLNAKEAAAIIDAITRDGTQLNKLAESIADNYTPSKIKTDPPINFDSMIGSAPKVVFADILSRNGLTFATFETGA